MSKSDDGDTRLKSICNDVDWRVPKKRSRENDKRFWAIANKNRDEPFQFSKKCFRSLSFSRVVFSGRRAPSIFIYKIDQDTYLKLLDIEDAEALFALIDGSRRYLRAWLPWVDHTRSMADSRVFIESTKKQFAENQGFQVGIWYQHKLAGVAGFHKIDWQDRKTEIGYWLGEPFQGYGLMTKTCRVLLNHAFRKWKLHRVEIRCAADNSASCAIPERLGFVQEGYIREAQQLREEYFVSLYIYGILRKTWLGRQR